MENYISVTKEQFELLINETPRPTSLKLIEEPALSDFTLAVEDKSVFFVRYYKFPCRIALFKEDGSVMDEEALVHGIIGEDPFLEIGERLNFFIGYNGKKLRTIVPSELNSFLNQNSMEGAAMFANFCAAGYAAIQYAMHNNKTIFKAEGRQKVVLEGCQPDRKAGVKGIPRKVGVYQCISIDEKEIHKFSRKHVKQEIICPAWGVRGHYRHYKDGKTIFIREYIKGKDKSQYTGREYALFP